MRTFKPSLQRLNAMRKAGAASYDAYSRITSLVDDTVSSARRLLQSLGNEEECNDDENDEQQQNINRTRTFADRTVPEATSNALPLLGLRSSQDIYRSLDKKKIMITRTYQAEQEISDDLARELEIDCALHLRSEKPPIQPTLRENVIRV